VLRLVLSASQDLQCLQVNPNKRSEILHRFSGTTTHGEIFFVQIKEDLKKGQKHFISVFPA
jgi:hypothetical protein